MSEGPSFLEVDEVLEIHRLSIANYGGEDGLRDSGALDSAIQQPRATFGGALLHGDLWSQAAAYLYHLVKNHPFVDGNKRVGTASALIFLRINGIIIEADEDELSALVLDVVAGRHDKPAIAGFLRRHAVT